MKSILVLLGLIGFVAFAKAIPVKEVEKLSSYPERENSKEREDFEKNIADPKDPGYLSKRFFCMRDCHTTCYNVPCKCSGFYIFKRCASTCKKCVSYCHCHDW